MENKLMKLKLDNGEEISTKVKMAKSIETRLLGLMFTKEMDGFEALLLEPCNSIHTFFMLMDIDVIFLDKENKILKVIYGMKPWRMTRIYFNARKVLEMKAGTLSKNIKVGEYLREYV